MLESRPSRSPFRPKFEQTSVRPCADPLYSCCLRYGFPSASVHCRSNHQCYQAKPGLSRAAKAGQSAAMFMPIEESGQRYAKSLSAKGGAKTAHAFFKVVIIVKTFTCADCRKLGGKVLTTLRTSGFLRLLARAGLIKGVVKHDTPTKPAPRARGLF